MKTRNILKLGLYVVTLATFALVVGMTWGTKLRTLNGLFCVHPTMMAIAVLLLFSQAVTIFYVRMPPHPRSTTIPWHAAFGTLGVMFMTIGLVSIEAWKKRTGTPHLNNPHSILGIMLYAFTLLQGFAGAWKWLGVVRRRKVALWHPSMGMYLMLAYVIQMCLGVSLLEGAVQEHVIVPAWVMVGGVGLFVLFFKYCMMAGLEKKWMHLIPDPEEQQTLLAEEQLLSEEGIVHRVPVFDDDDY